MSVVDRAVPALIRAACPRIARRGRRLLIQWGGPCHSYSLSLAWRKADRANW
jgi:hypothetical protein